MFPMLARGLLQRPPYAFQRLRGRSLAARAAPNFNYTELFATEGPKDTPYKLVSKDHVSTFTVNGEKMLKARLTRRAAGI